MKTKVFIYRTLIGRDSSCNAYVMGFNGVAYFSSGLHLNGAEIAKNWISNNADKFELINL